MPRTRQQRSLQPSPPTQRPPTTAGRHPIHTPPRSSSEVRFASSSSDDSSNRSESSLHSESEYGSPTVGLPAFVIKELALDIDRSGGPQSITKPSVLCNRKPEIYGTAKSTRRRAIGNKIYQWKIGRLADYNSIVNPSTPQRTESASVVHPSTPRRKATPRDRPSSTPKHRKDKASPRFLTDCNSFSTMSTTKRKTGKNGQGKSASLPLQQLVMALTHCAPAQQIRSLSIWTTPGTMAGSTSSIAVMSQSAMSSKWILSRSCCTSILVTMPRSCTR